MGSEDSPTLTLILRATEDQAHEMRVLRASMDGLRAEVVAEARKTAILDERDRVRAEAEKTKAKDDADRMSKIELRLKALEDLRTRVIAYAMGAAGVAQFGVYAFNEWRKLHGG